MSSRRLTASFFLRPDVVIIGRELLGKHLYARTAAGAVTGGAIVETEAYAGPQDRASHAFGNKVTQRNAVMYARGPVAYVYLCYGRHWLFNIVTNGPGVPHAVLIRALQPLRGIALMRKRRGKSRREQRLASGPGALAQALGICGRHSGLSLLGDRIWLEAGQPVPPELVGAGPRIGVGYAGPDARLPWRFYIRGNPWVSGRPPAGRGLNSA